MRTKTLYQEWREDDARLKEQDKEFQAINAHSQEEQNSIKAQLENKLKETQEYLSKLGIKEQRMSTQGTKHDQGKAPLSLIPREALEQEAEVFGFGAKKYGRFNYKRGMNWSRVVDAALRHVNAFASGENLDPESGKSHLAHAKCCLSMLMYYIANNKGTDDRTEDKEEPNDPQCGAV